MWSYDDLSIFVCVVEQGNFANAAKKLNIPSSTVCRRISKLEKDLKIKLIERNSRKFNVTKLGQEFYDRSYPAFQLLKKSASSLMASHEEVSGKLRITAPFFLLQELLNVWVIDFLKLFDGVEIEIISENTYTDLISEQIDIAFRVGPLKNSDFIARKLWDVKISACASKEYLLSRSAIKVPEDINDHSAIFYRREIEEWSFRQPEDKKTIVVRPKGKFYVNDIKTVIAAIKAGVGISCVPKFAVRGDIRDGSVITLFDDYTITPERSVFAVYPDNKFMSKTAQIFLQYIRERFTEFDEKMGL
jgi:DNA-binding transcriptional LysR family regulator